MPDYLFAYGTLLPGAAPAEISGAAARLKAVGEGQVRGLLYDLGHFPGAVLDAAGNEFVNTAQSTSPKSMIKTAAKTKATIETKPSG